MGGGARLRYIVGGKGNIITILLIMTFFFGYILYRN